MPGASLQTWRVLFIPRSPAPSAPGIWPERSGPAIVWGLSTRVCMLPFSRHSHFPSRPPVPPRPLEPARRGLLARGGPLSRALGAAIPLALAACGEAPRTIDAPVAPSAQTSEVSIRFDVSAGRPATVQVLAFRATTTANLTGTSVAPAPWQPDVLGIVDPLAAAAPEQGCALRDIDVAATALMIRGGSIELQELPGIGVGVGGEGLAAAETLLRPFPRMYPDVATVVGGVVAETGPHK